MTNLIVLREKEGRGKNDINKLAEDVRKMLENGNVVVIPSWAEATILEREVTE